MDYKTIETKVIEVIKDISNENNISIDTDINKLDLDSLDLAEIPIALEDKFHITITDKDQEKYFSKPLEIFPEQRTTSKPFYVKDIVGFLKENYLN